MAGIRSRPAVRVARQRRSPMISSYWGCPSTAPAGRTTTGCSTPISRTEYTSSAIDSSSKTWRGWRGLGTIEVTGISAKLAPGTGTRSAGSDGAAAASAALEPRPLPEPFPDPFSPRADPAVVRPLAALAGASVASRSIASTASAASGDRSGKSKIDGPIARRLGGGRPARDERPEPAPQTASLLAHACSSRTSSGLRTSAASTCSASSRAASR